MIEIFKDVPGFEGFYQVSNFGNVKSVERKYWRETSYHSGHWATRREKMLTPMPDKQRICPRKIDKRQWVYLMESTSISCIGISQS